jgi:hypothetical protein
MNFFQLQNNLFYSKKSKEPLDVEGEKSFSPFMFNRWLSFYNKDLASFTNETLNKFHSLFDDRQETYKLYFNLIPRLKFKKIEYIKKKTNEDKEDELHLIAKSNCISKREIQQYVDLQKYLAK